MKRELCANGGIERLFQPISGFKMSPVKIRIVAGYCWVPQNQKKSFEVPCLIEQLATMPSALETIASFVRVFGTLTTISSCFPRPILAYIGHQQAGMDRNYICAQWPFQNMVVWDESLPPKWGEVANTRFISLASYSHNKIPFSTVWLFVIGSSYTPGPRSYLSPPLPQRVFSSWSS